MSTYVRKLGYYSLEFIRAEENRFFEQQIFIDFLRYIGTLPCEDALFNDVRNKKAVSVDTLIEQSIQGMTIFKIIFKSCKYNHSPNYMSSVDGSERPTSKTLNEGDKEITHLCLRVDDDEAFCILEERRNGVTIGGIVKYLNTMLHPFLQGRGIHQTYSMVYGIVPSEDFLTSLRSLRRITVAELYTNRDLLVSGYFGDLHPDDDMQENVIVTLKAKNRKSIIKRLLETAYHRTISQGTQVKRIRLYGKDNRNMNVTLDSKNSRRLEEVVVELNQDTGIVDSYSVFAKIEEVLGVTE